MAIIGIAGQIGSGKSHAQLAVAIDYAEERRKQLVCNFPVNREALINYCALPKEAFTGFGMLKLLFSDLFYGLGNLLDYFMYMFGLTKRRKYRSNNKIYKPKYPFLLGLLQKGMGVIEIVNPEKLETLMIPESVICLDEAGVFLNARDFGKTSRRLLADLAQSRKDGCDLIWAAQFDGQVDRQFRQLTQFWWHCRGYTKWNKQMRRPELTWKSRYYFMADDYDIWINNPKLRLSFFKTRLVYATLIEEGGLTKADYQLFKCFDSFRRLDSAGSTITTISTTAQCLLTKGYYEHSKIVVAELKSIRNNKTQLSSYNRLALWIERLDNIQLLSLVGYSKFYFKIKIILAYTWWLYQYNSILVSGRQDALDQFLLSAEANLIHHSVTLYHWFSGISNKGRKYQARPRQLFNYTDSYNRLINSQHQSSSDKLVPESTVDISANGHSKQVNNHNISLPKISEDELDF